MLYVVFGIIILIVSFVIALVSLVYEQKKVEGRKAQEEAQDSIVEAGVGDEIVNLPLSKRQEQQTTTEWKAVLSGEAEDISNQEQKFDNTLGVDKKPNLHFSGIGNELDVSSVQMTAEEPWWDKLAVGSSGRGNVLADSDEEKSIRAIQEELARRASRKSGQIKIDMVKTEDRSHVNRNAAKRSNFLTGEFSLSDFRDKG